MMQSSSAASQPKPLNIWAQMSYVPPRGPCAQKTSYIQSCPCLRFMVHPLKAATTFDCDGCGHHASFHKMDNPQDDEVVRRWEQMRTAVDESHDNAAIGVADKRPRTPDEEQVVPKRRRIMNKSQAGRSVLKPHDTNRRSTREKEIQEILE
ncbi:hypothetical protein MMC07_007723 [Pseudocyphellaria aurata]|nr:hypothetical protein [Pseudocyphellaria aurata]